MAPPRIAVIGIPGGWSSEGLRRALERLGARAFLVPYSGIEARLSPFELRLGAQSGFDIQAVVVKKLGESSDRAIPDRIACLQALHASGVPVFSPPEAIACAVDRLGMTLKLALEGIPTPKTLITEDIDGVQAFLEEVPDAVLKPLYTSKAKGMVRLGSRNPAFTEENLKEWQRVYGPFFYIQEFIEAKGGRDIGAMFLGGKFLKAYARVAKAGSWKTTTAEGGHYEPCELPDQALEIARKAERAFGLSYAGVDLVEGPSGFYVYEVSAFGGFRGLHEAYGMDAAAMFAEYVLEQIA